MPLFRERGLALDHLQLLLILDDMQAQEWGAPRREGLPVASPGQL